MPASVGPFGAIPAGLEGTVGALFPPERHDYARQRQAVIAANTALQERELIKLTSLSAALAGTLRQRGVGDPTATLAAEAGIVVFRVAFERWVGDDNQRDLTCLIREALDELRAITAGT